VLAQSAQKPIDCRPHAAQLHHHHRRPHQRDNNPLVSRKKQRFVCSSIMSGTFTSRYTWGQLLGTTTVGNGIRPQARKPTRAKPNRIPRHQSACLLGHDRRCKTPWLPPTLQTLALSRGQLSKISAGRERVLHQWMAVKWATKSCLSPRKRTTNSPFHANPPGGRSD